MASDSLAGAMPRICRAALDKVFLCQQVILGELNIISFSLMADIAMNYIY